ncbi:MAG: 3-phenylpropionate/trans-cinnamate dioxygenase ferredoxin subunit [Parasphingorhabdus sp.]|jgi:3-phenylpropionate/trans-cinnamate dioxygenase ferredoxin subunit
MNRQKSQFIDVAAMDALKPGDMLRVNAFGERILLANDGDDLYAVSDTCSHEDASLSLGALKNATISCPLHGSRFCLRTGAALDEPAEVAIQVYTVEVIEGRIMLAKSST